MARVILQGVPALEAALKKLGSAVTSELDRAATLGMTAIYVQAQANALPHRKSGRTMEHMVIRPVNPAEADLGWFQPVAGFRTTSLVQLGFEKEAWYWRLVELGHAKVPPGQAGATRPITSKTPIKQRESAITAGGFGWVPAYPFMKPAFDARWREARDIVAFVLQKAVEGVVSL